METLDSVVAELVGLAVEARKDLHRHPEVGLDNHATAERLRAWAQAHAGARPEEFVACPSSGSGFYWDVRGPGAGPWRPAVALRADTDALPSTEASGAAHASQCAGRHHACGHDGHMASLLLTAALLHRARGRLPAGVAVRVFFQPGEESPGGADPMVRDGLLDGVGEVYGYHNWPRLPVGTVAVRPGAMMAHAAELRVTVHGRSGHASTPHLCANPVAAAAAMVAALPTALQNTVDAAQHAVVTVSTIRGGEVNNVIGDRCEFGGTIRNFDPAVHAAVLETVRRTCDAVAALHRVRADVRIEEQYPAVVNHAAPTEHVRAVAAALLGADRVVADGLPVLAAEDFSYYLERVPGCFFFLGSSHDDAVPATSPMLHTSAYDFEDRVLRVAASLFVRLVEHRLSVTLYH